MPSTDRATLMRRVTELREVFVPYERAALVQEDIAALHARENGGSEGGVMTLFGDSRSEGALAVVATDGTKVGFQRLRFSVDGVRRLCRAREAVDPMTVQAAAERAGLKWQVVANLVTRGFVPTRSGLVDADDLDGFLATHVTGSALARECGTSPGSLSTRLAGRGILPVVGPGTDGSRQNIYRRTDVGEVGLSTGSRGTD